jgi:hypothetical protein
MYTNISYLFKNINKNHKTIAIPIVISYGDPNHVEIIHQIYFQNLLAIINDFIFNSLKKVEKETTGILASYTCQKLAGTSGGLDKSAGY